jgi:uncharacterized protein (DUF2252 family)
VQLPRAGALCGIARGREKPRKGRRLCLIDIKEAVQAAAPRHSAATMPQHSAMRVVEGARHLSPALGDRMLAATFLDRTVYMRELLPEDLKLEVDKISREEAMKAARYLAQWREELGRNRSASLHAPNWLWSSIVELVASHEAAYLEHCRRYAIDTELAA